MPRVVVTGGTGFIGFNLACYLEEKGFDVVAFDNRAAMGSMPFFFKGKLSSVDVTQKFDLEGPVDAVFHQASLTDPRYENDLNMFESNLRGFREVVSFCQRKGARLIYASTAGLYGNGSAPMKEGQPPECLTAYGRSKLEIERLALSLSQEMDIVGLRYFNVFGPFESQKGRPASMIFHLSQQMKAGKRPRIFTGGEQKRDHIYVKDVVWANLCALSSASGVYNVGTGIGTSFNELVSILNEVLGTQLQVEYFDMPYDPKTYQHCTIADTTLAESELGFKAKWNLKSAVADYLSWLESNPS